MKACVKREIMMSRVLFTALLAAAVVGTTVQSDAAPRRGQQPRSYQLYVAPQEPTLVERFFGASAPRWQYQRPFAWYNTSLYNYPGPHYNNTTFWERVNTQANFPVQY
jgi:hypothetical protein